MFPRHLAVDHLDDLSTSAGTPHLEHGRKVPDRLELAAELRDDERRQLDSRVHIAPAAAVRRRHEVDPTFDHEPLLMPVDTSTKTHRDAHRLHVTSDRLDQFERLVGDTLDLTCGELTDLISEVVHGTVRQTGSRNGHAHAATSSLASCDDRRRRDPPADGCIARQRCSRNS